MTTKWEAKHTQALHQLVLGAVFVVAGTLMLIGSGCGGSVKYVKVRCPGHPDKNVEVQASKVSNAQLRWDAEYFRALHKCEQEYPRSK